MKGETERQINDQQSISDDNQEHGHENSVVDNSNSWDSHSPEKETTAGNHSHRKVKKKKKKSNTALVVNLAETRYNVVKKAVKNTLKMKVIRDAASEEWDLFWTDNAVTPERLAKMKMHQKINHFPGMFTLSRKNNLARNLVKMEAKFPNEYNFFPKTWVLPSELNELRKYMESYPSTVLIAKPEASSQGKGIFLSKSIEDFEFGEHYVVQKYLKKPFLIDGLKFDLRVYVLVAGCDPLRLYVYKEGLARFATQPYKNPHKDNLKNLYMHLTNYAINKNSSKFQFNASKDNMGQGHKRSLSSVLNRIALISSPQKRDELWESIKDCIAKTLISGQPLLSHHYRSCQSQNYANNMCFEILGLDVILDSNLKPQILQVNYTPSFTTDTPLDYQIKHNLITESLRLVNLTSKARNQSIAQKKKQMQERSLTGKKIYHSKKERKILVDTLQQIRNVYETKNIGNFQRILPVPIAEDDGSASSEGVMRNQQNYQQFIQFAQECYHEITGANIRRNRKPIKSGLKAVNAKETELSDESQSKQKQVITNQNMSHQPAKFTNTENLQKIYRAKFRPMIYNRKNIHKKESQVQLRESKDSPVQEQHRSKLEMGEKGSKTCKNFGGKPEKSQKVSTRNTDTIMPITTKENYKEKFIGSEVSNLKHSQKRNYVNPYAQKSAAMCHNVMLSHQKFRERKQKQSKSSIKKMEEEEEIPTRTDSSGNPGFSKVYNLTFEDRHNRIYGNFSSQQAVIKNRRNYD